MQLFGATLRFFAGVCAFAAGTVLLGLPAAAEGTARIQQADGTVNVYQHVKIQLVQKSLTMTTADGKGTMIIYRAACSFQGDVMSCLPTGITLVQSGAVNPIKLLSGTVYVNLTGDPHRLALSTTTLPPHSVMMALKTRKGTYVSLSGTIDKEKQ